MMLFLWTVDWTSKCPLFFAPLPLLSSHFRGFAPCSPPLHPPSACLCLTPHLAWPASSRVHHRARQSPSIPISQGSTAEKWMNFHLLCWTKIWDHLLAYIPACRKNCAALFLLSLSFKSVCSLLSAHAANSIIVFFAFMVVSKDISYSQDI